MAEWYLETGKECTFSRMRPWEEAKMESAFTLGHDTVTYAWKISSEPEEEWWSYVVDLRRMEQTNVNTGTMRRLLRLTETARTHALTSPFAM